MYTFSTTVSADVVRWFYALATALRKEPRGLDLVQGYLQAAERLQLYAYRPSHAGYSELSFEQLAVLRAHLLSMQDKHGEHFHE